VKESPVQFECKVRQVIETGSRGGAANLVICEVNMIHVYKDILDQNGVPDPNKINLVGRHTGDFYVKAFGESLFEVEKPLARLGIGIDSLPDNIKFSKILTGNDLGQLGNAEAMPSEVEIKNITQNPVVKNILEELKNNPLKLEQELQTLAKKWIDDGRVPDAFALLMV
jgi:hypothetical protein